MAAPRNNTYAVASGAGVYAGRVAAGYGNVRIAIWGQSNAIGRALRTDISASPLSSDPELEDFDAGTFDRVYIWASGAYAKLQPSVNNGADAGQFGAEFGLAVRWMRETTSGNLYLEKHAGSGLSIDSNMFKRGIWPYTTAVSNRASANSWLSTNGITLDREAWLWVQGESDMSQTQSWYQTRLEQLIADRLLDGFQDSSALNMLAQMATGTAGYGAGVAAGKAAIAAANPSNTVAFAAPGYMKADNLHQNGRGQVQLGYDAFEQCFGAAHIST